MVWCGVRVKWLSITVMALLILSGCSSCMIKQDCEKTNWFEHAKKVALQGKYLEEDEQVLKCKKVDVMSHKQLDMGYKEGRGIYCTLEQINKNAQQGNPVNFSMCVGLPGKSMREQYSEGLKTFCTSNSGYQYGSSGEVYKNVCSPAAEKVFLPSYFKGRTNYLTNYIQDKKDVLVNLEKQDQRFSFDVSRLSNEINSLPRLQECHQERFYNKSSKQTEDRRVCQEPEYIRIQRDTLSHQLNRARSQKDQNTAKITQVTGELENAQNELAKIPK